MSLLSGRVRRPDIPAQTENSNERFAQTASGWDDDIEESIAKWMVEY